MGNGYTLEAYGRDHPGEIELDNIWWTKRWNLKTDSIHHQILKLPYAFKNLSNCNGTALEIGYTWGEYGRDHLEEIEFDNSLWTKRWNLKTESFAAISLPKCNGIDFGNGYTLGPHSRDHPEKIEFGNSWWTKCWNLKTESFSAISLPKCNGTDWGNGYTLGAHGCHHPKKIEFGNSWWTPEKIEFGYSWWTKYFRQTYSTLEQCVLQLPRIQTDKW